MVTKRKIITFISVIYWAFIFVNIGLKFYNELFVNEYYSDIFSSLNFGTIISFIILNIAFFIFFLVFTIFEYYLLTILYFGVILAINEFYRDKIDYSDQKNVKYYRHLLKDYSAGTLGYIQDFKISSKELVASMMLLELKNKISLSKEIVVKDDSLTELQRHEDYLLKKVIDGDMSKIKLNDYKKKVIEDCLNQGLLIKKKNVIEKIEKKIILFGVMVIVFFVNLVVIPEVYNRLLLGKNVVLDDVFQIFTVSNWLLVFIIPISYMIYLVVYGMMSKINPYERSEKTKKINNKLNGLKKFLKDFSVIHERDYQELKLWEDYLIYSVIFGQNDDIRDEILKKINR